MQTIATLLVTLFFASTALAEVGINCRITSVTSGPIQPGDRQVAVDVACDGGLVLTGGGSTCGLDPATTGVAILSNTYPEGTPSEWYCTWDNQTLLTVNCSCDAVCCTMTPDTGPPAVICEHDECLQGVALDAGPPACSECVEAVCACDAYCCENQWDSYCAHEAQNLCGKTCNSTAVCIDACNCGAGLPE